jgi:hypothetical protein
MNELCFLSNLTSAELAAWVQAIGSIVAIFAAAAIAILVARLQHNNALDLHKTEKRTEKVEIAKTLFVLATNSSKAMKHIASQLNDRESVYNAAEGLEPCGVGELHRLEKYLNGIPLLAVPHSIVTLTMILGSTVLDFKEKVEMALNFHRKMDADMFDDFFQTIAKMNTSIEATCKDIDAEVKRLETSVVY